MQGAGVGCILGQGQGINHMPLVGCGQKKKKKKTQDFLRGAPADPDPGEMGRFGDSRVPGCRRAVSEPHTSARAFAGKPAASAGAGPQGEKSGQGLLRGFIRVPAPLKVPGSSMTGSS